MVQCANDRAETILERGEKTVAGRNHKGCQMPTVADEPLKQTTRRHAPALGIEERENQLIAMAMDRAEEKFVNHTASDTLTVHFLRLATTRMELEKEKIRKEIAQIEAKTDAIQSMAKMEELYENAMNAMKRYGGSINQDVGEDV